MERKAKECGGAAEPLIAEAKAIHAEDVAMCRAMGAHGAAVVPEHARILTHCNAGALATGGYGTALGVIRAAHEAGKVNMVYCDETRPLLQGARLTAYELVSDHIPATLIADNMAASLMAKGKIDLAVVGCDRMAANGDFANKIGTYSVAVNAHYHGIPFYVALPCSTIDLSLADGSGIPIEERDRDEVRTLYGTRTAPESVEVCNPAFDVNPPTVWSPASSPRRGSSTRPFRRICKSCLDKDGPMGTPAPAGRRADTRRPFYASPVMVSR